MILLQFHEVMISHTLSSSTVSGRNETRRKSIILHNQIEIVEQENGTCIINDNEACRTYRPVESYTEILDKLAEVVHIA